MIVQSDEVLITSPKFCWEKKKSKQIHKQLWKDLGTNNCEVQCALKDFFTP